MYEEAISDIHTTLCLKQRPKPRKTVKSVKTARAAREHTFSNKTPISDDFSRAQWLGVTTVTSKIEAWKHGKLVSKRRDKPITLRLKKAA